MSALSDEFPAEDYSVLTTNYGVGILSDWSVITLQGDDRRSFLHNMCTNAIRELDPGDGCEAFLTDVKGKIQAHCGVIAREDRLLLVTVPGQAQRIIDQLGRYIIREDVQLSDETLSSLWAICSRSSSPSPSASRW